jgi:hypothetical protein
VEYRDPIISSSVMSRWMQGIHHGIKQGVWDEGGGDCRK